ncbi:peptide/nickel transport system substrate-binding protein [Microbacterium sp. ZKA21]|uniref:ABC transporter substrate-binding protein n=1 Tax=Microbacterium sp. ZKA21 TaxID=3381694 RepID=UPI003D21DDF6
MRAHRRIAASLIVLLAAGLAACAPALPATVVAGSAITVGWTGELTSTNAATAPTSGNIDIAELIRAGFGDVVDGEFVPDEGFGTASIVSDDPFTVRYDLAEPAWSDGIPLDAADLMLGWTGASGYFPTQPEDAEAPVEPQLAEETPVVDEFARAIDVTFPGPDIDWQQRVPVPVPAHVVGQRAFGIDDAMEAKQAVIRAIEDADTAALEKIAEVWNTGFAFTDPSDVPADLLISSGPFTIDEIVAAEAGQSVTLVPNAAYRGPVTPQIARIDLVPPGDDPVGAIGQVLDVAQVAPTASNRAPIHDLERKDFAVTTTHDGTLWSLLLKPAGVFAQQQARIAFIHAVPVRPMVDRGAGEWASAYTASTAMLAAPGSRAYDIVNEDSGFAELLGEPGDDPALQREFAGVPDGAAVCVLYDRHSEFATGAFAALRESAAESGWNAIDCGSDDYRAALAQGRWDAVIARVPIPQTPEQIAVQWGSGGSASVTGHADADRDALITELAQTTDVYEAREVLAIVEASIVRAAVALPIATNPRITIVDKDVTGVAPRNGAAAPLTYGAVQWAVVP